MTIRKEQKNSIQTQIIYKNKNSYKKSMQY